MGTSQEKSKSGMSNKDDTSSDVPSSSTDKMDLSDDWQKGDDIQLQTKNQENLKHPKRPDYPKKPPTSYNFFVKEKKDTIWRNNPGMNHMEFSSLAGKMFKALSGKKKQKYVELARVAREEYKKQVQEEAYPDQKRPDKPADYPKKPPTSYNFFVNDEKVKIWKNNPELSPMEFSSLAGKMFKALSEKKKQKYVELARVAREKYRKEVEKLKEANNPIRKPVETSQEELETPVAPTPFLLFCSKKMKERQSISWCVKKFPSLPDKERLKWINLALAQEANYLEEFEKFKTENPHLNPYMKPVLNEKEKLLVSMRDEMPVKPPSTAFYLFVSEYPSIPKNKDMNREMWMAQWSASWKALSKKERKIYQTRVIAMKDEYKTKLSTYLSNFPTEKRLEEITDRLSVANGMKRKKRAETDKSGASSKKSKTATSDDSDLDSYEKEDFPPPQNIGSKKNATQVKGSWKTSSSIALDASYEPDNSDDVTLPNGKLMSPYNAAESSEESMEESDSESKQSSFPEKLVSKLPSTDLSAFSKKTKVGNRNPFTGRGTSISTSSESQEMSRASSNSSKSAKALIPPVIERSAIQCLEDTSDEVDSSEEESGGLNKKSTLKSPTETSDDESDSDDNTKLSAYLSKLPSVKRRKGISKYLPGIKGAETDKAVDSSKKSKPAFMSENDLDIESDDVIQPKKNRISPRKLAEESSEESPGDSDLESELSSPPMRSSSTLDTEESQVSNSAKKTKFCIGNPSPRRDTLNGSDPSNTSCSDEEPQQISRASSRSFISGNKIQSEEDTSEEFDSSEEEEENESSSMTSSSKPKNNIGSKGKSTLESLPKPSEAVDSSDEFDSDDNDDDDDSTPTKKKQICPPKSAEESCEETSAESDSDDNDDENPSKKKRIANPSPRRNTLNGSDPSNTFSSDEEPQQISRASSSSFVSGSKMVPSVTKGSALQSEEDTSEEFDSSGEEEENESYSITSSSKPKNKIGLKGKSTLKSLPKPSAAVDSSDEFDSDDNDDENPSKKKQAAPQLAEKSSGESSENSESQPEQSSLSKKNVSLLRRAIIAANASSSLRKDGSSSSVRPSWASRQKLFKNEPPKPPKTAAEWHAFEICKVSNIPEKKKKDLWNELSEKMRKKLKMEHTKRLEEYEEKLQSFKKGLNKTELRAYERFKRSQRAASDDESEQ